MDLRPLSEAIRRGDRRLAIELTTEALDGGAPAGSVLDALIAGMYDVGRRFKANEVYVPEVLISSNAMRGAMDLIEPHLRPQVRRPVSTAVIGTVKGDLHDIGKNLVAMMWRSVGFEVVDLGIDVSPAAFVKAVAHHRAKLVGLSALLTTTMLGMRTTIEAIREAGFENLTIMVGGAPVTQEFADRIGADAFAPDGMTAAEMVRERFGSRPSRSEGYTASASPSP